MASPRTDAPADRDRRSRRVVTGLWLAAFAALLFGSRLYWIGAYGNATPYWDQWGAEGNDIYKPWLEGRLGWNTLVVPHNVHRIFTSRLLALGLLAANGIWNPKLQMVVTSALWVGTLATMVILFDRATGRRHLLPLLAFALVTFGLPACNKNMLWGFQGAFYFVILWGLLALRAIALAPPFASGWWAGLGCGLLCFLSLGSGAFTAAAAAAVAAAQYATGARRGRLQLASVGVFATLFAVGVALSPSDRAMATTRAASVGQALSAWARAASWPLEIGPLGTLVALGPALVLAAVILRRRPPAGDSRWFLLAAVAGALGHPAAIAYGRASICLNSRYYDLYAVGMFVNFACALAVFPELAARGRGRAVAAVVAWVGIMLGALAVHTHRHALEEMVARRDTAAVQQVHTRAYVLTRDMQHLRDKPPLHVPHPRPDRLAKILDDPAVRSILPTVVAPPLAASAFTSDPPEAFVEGGAEPALPAQDTPGWGSHGATAAAAEGVATITFGRPHRAHAVALPVAAGGDRAGIAIEIEQDGRRRPIPVPAVTGDWTPVRVEVQGRPFTLHVTDHTAAGWVAVGAPAVEGRFDRSVERLLADWDEFVLAGIVLGAALLVHAGLAGAAD